MKYKTQSPPIYKSKKPVKARNHHQLSINCELKKGSINIRKTFKEEKEAVMWVREVMERGDELYCTVRIHDKIDSFVVFNHYQFEAKI